MRENLREETGRNGRKRETQVDIITQATDEPSLKLIVFWFDVMIDASAQGHLFHLLISARVFCNHGCTGYFCKSLFCWNVKYVKSFFRCCHCICWSVVILLHPFLRVVQVVGAAHPTTTMAAQPKRARGAAAPRQSMLKSINAHVEAVQSGATAQTIKNIVAFLEGKPEQAERVWIALTSNYFEKPSTMVPEEKFIPASRTSIGILSYKFLMDTLVFSTSMQAKTLSNLKAVGGKEVIYRLWYFAMADEAATRLFTHSVEDFKQGYAMRYRQLGNRLRFLRFLDNGTPDWLHSGSYHLEGGGDESFVIVHCSGAAVHCNIDAQLVHTNMS